MREAPKKKPHRHAQKWRSLYDGVLLDEYGREVIEMQYCKLCDRVPDNNEFIGWTTE